MKPVAAAVRPAAYAGLAVGLALFTGLVAYRGVREVAAALVVAGPGLVVVAFFHLGPMLADALGWRTLLGAAHRPSVLAMLRARWIGESVNGLLPVMQVGGNVVKARLLAARGIPRDRAAATVVVDVMLVVATQVAFTLGGVALLLRHVGGRELVPAAVGGAALMSTLLAGFYLAQRRGLFVAMARGLGHVLGGASDALTAGAASLDTEVRRLSRDRRTMAASAAWHLASWVIGAGEVWLALRFLGHPVDLEQALLLESLGQAVRAAAFAIPGALGVQEGGYILLGAVLGLAGETSLALSLAKRVREILLGLPGLLVWQAEGAMALVRTGDRGTT